MKTKQLFSIIFSVIFILLAVAFVFTYQQGYKTGSTESKEEITKLKEDLKKIKESKEYIAVQVCKSETRWKPECLAEEMNNNFKRDPKDYE